MRTFVENKDLRMMDRVHSQYLKYFNLIMKKLLILIQLIICINYSFGQDSLQILKKNISKSKEDTAKIKATLKIISVFSANNQLDSVLYYANKSMPLTNKQPYYALNYQYFYEYANAIYHKNQNIILASKYYLKAIEVANRNGLSKNKAVVDYAAACIELGLYPQASQTLIKILPELEVKKDTFFLSRVYPNLLSIYSKTEDYQKMTYYAKKSIDMAQNQSPRFQIIVYNRAGVAYFDTGDYEKMWKMWNKGLALAGNDDGLKKAILSNIGEFYLRQKQYKKALQFTQKALDIATKLNDEKYIVSFYQCMADIYLDMKEYTKALNYYDKSINYFANNGYEDITTELLEKMSKANAELGNFEKAYQLQKDAINKQNKLLDIQKRVVMMDLDFSYQLSQKEKLLDEVKIQNEFQNQKLLLEKKQKSLLIVFSILLVASLAFTLWNYKKKTFLSKKLALQKNSFEHQARQLAATNQQKDKLFAIISHDLRSPVTQLSNTLVLNDSPAFIAIRKEFENVQLVLNNLLEWSNIQLGKKQTPLIPTALSYLVGSVATQYKRHLEDKQITLIKDVDGAHVLVNIDSFLIVLRNIVSNAIKYTPAGGYIKIYLKNHTGDKIILMIKDSGIGMTEDEIQKIFEFPTSKIGTNNERGTGIGLSISKDIIENMGGQILITSNSNRGTLVNITLKKQC